MNRVDPIRFLSLCSGIEAASMAWLPLGWQCAAVAEIEKFPCAVLQHHFPDVPNLGDVNFITREQVESLGEIDVVIFGFPCQDLSVAGKRKGLKNADRTHTRSGLFFQCFEVARWTKARWIVVENVPGLFSSHQGRDFAAVAGELAGAEFDVPGDGWRNSGCALGENGLVEWTVLDAQYAHLAQRRERVFFVLDTGDWTNRPPLLSDAASLRWHPAPCRKPGQGAAHDVAPCIGASGRGFDRCGDTRGQDAVIAINGGEPSSIRGREAKEASEVIAHTLRGEGFDASEDGTGRGIPLVAGTLGSRHANTQLDQQFIPEIAGTLAFSGGHCAGSATNQDAHSNLLIPELAVLPVAFPANLSSTQHASAEDLSPAIGAENPTAVAIPINMQAAAKNGAKSPNMLGVGRDGDPAFTVNASDQHAIAFERRMVRTTGGQPQTELNHALRADTNAGDAAPCVAWRMEVRRLTPTECERLQGFPDGWTKIPWRGKPAETCPDGPRYRALGNSMAVPIIRWIGSQIEKAMNQNIRPVARAIKGMLREEQI